MLQHGTASLCCLKDDHILLVLSRRREDKLQQNVLHANSHVRVLVCCKSNNNKKCISCENRSNSVVSSVHFSLLPHKMNSAQQIDGANLLSIMPGRRHTCWFNYKQQLCEVEKIEGRVAGLQRRKTTFKMFRMCPIFKKRSQSYSSLCQICLYSHYSSS